MFWLKFSIIFQDVVVFLKVSFDFPYFWKVSFGQANICSITDRNFGHFGSIVNNHELKDDPLIWQWYSLPQWDLRMFILRTFSLTVSAHPNCTRKFAFRPTSKKSNMNKIVCLHWLTFDVLTVDHDAEFRAPNFQNQGSFPHAYLWNDVGKPQFVCISDTSNPSDCTKIKKIYWLENFCTDVLRSWTNDKCLATKQHQTLFGDQTWPNMLILKWVAKRLKHGWSNTDETIDTSRWASVEHMRASNMLDTRLSKRTKHRPSSTRTKEMFYVFDRMFDGLQILSNTTKYDQTRSNSTKQGVQTVKCLVTKHLSFVQALKAVAFCQWKYPFQYQ